MFVSGGTGVSRVDYRVNRLVDGEQMDIVLLVRLCVLPVSGPKGRLVFGRRLTVCSESVPLLFSN